MSKSDVWEFRGLLLLILSYVSPSGWMQVGCGVLAILFFGASLLLWWRQ